MATKFEKWVRTLKPELFLDKAGVHCTLCCEDCPAAEKCQTVAQRLAIRYCGERFMAWAQEEAGE